MSGIKRLGDKSTGHLIHEYCFMKLFNKNTDDKTKDCSNAVLVELKVNLEIVGYKCRECGREWRIV